jgi:hypothetical protein
MQRPTKAQLLDFGVLVLRAYLVFYLLNYGWGKVTMGQFGVSEDIASQPLKEVETFYVAWHLFQRSIFFNVAGGVLEMVAALLLIWHRTVLIGALLAIVILAQIFVIDVSFTMGVHLFALPTRILGMIGCAVLILLYHKDQVVRALQQLITSSNRPKFNYQWWIIPILLVLGFLMDFVLGLLLMPLRLLLDHFFL